MSYCDCAEEYQRRLGQNDNPDSPEQEGKSLSELPDAARLALTAKDDAERLALTAKDDAERLALTAKYGGQSNRPIGPNNELLDSQKRARLLELSSKSPDSLPPADAEELENLRKLAAAERALLAAGQGPEGPRPYSWWYDFWVPVLSAAALLLTIYAILKRFGYWDAMKRRLAHSALGRALLQSAAGRYLANSWLGRLLGLDVLLKELDCGDKDVCCPVRLDRSKLKWPVEPTVTPFFDIPC